MGGQTFGKDGALTLESRSLATGSAQTKSYSIVIPKDLKDKIKIKIEAVPENISADASTTRNWGRFFPLLITRRQKTGQVILLTPKRRTRHLNSMMHITTRYLEMVLEQ